MFTKKFWKDALERAAWTAAQSLLGILAVAGATVFTISWPAALGIVATATVVSILKSMVVNASSDTDTASVVVNTVEKS